MRTEEQRGILSTNFVTTARTEVILVGGSLNVVWVGSGLFLIRLGDDFNQRSLSHFIKNTFRQKISDFLRDDGYVQALVNYFYD